MISCHAYRQSPTLFPAILVNSVSSLNASTRLMDFEIHAALFATRFQVIYLTNIFETQRILKLLGGVYVSPAKADGRLCVLGPRRHAQEG